VTTIGDYSYKANDAINHEPRDLVFIRQPTSLVVDNFGNLYYVIDSTIRKMTPKGDVTIIAGVPGRKGIELGKQGLLDEPCGLTMLDSNTLALISGNAILKLSIP